MITWRKGRRGHRRCGAVIAGRRTYDVSDGWSGAGPMGPRPLFLVTRRPPDEIPLANPPYTFVTDGIPAAVAAARNAAGDQDVVLMGRAWYSSASGRAARRTDH